MVQPFVVFGSETRTVTAMDMETVVRGRGNIHPITGHEGPDVE